MDWIVRDWYNQLMQSHSHNETLSLLREVYGVDDQTLYRLFH